MTIYFLKQFQTICFSIRLFLPGFELISTTADRLVWEDRHISRNLPI